MIRINLLPVREERRKANLRQQGLLLGAGLGAALVLCVALHVQVTARISHEQREIVAAKAELERLKETLAVVDAFRKEKQEIERKLGIIARLEENRVGPVQVLDEIATRIPERAWLTQLSMKSGKLELEGYSLDNEVIAAFLTSLSESPLLVNVELGETHLMEQDGLKLNEFTISCREKRALEEQKAKAAAKAKGRQARGL